MNVLSQKTLLYLVAYAYENIRKLGVEKYLPVLNDYLHCLFVGERFLVGTL